MGFKIDDFITKLISKIKVYVVIKQIYTKLFQNIESRNIYLYFTFCSVYHLFRSLRLWRKTKFKHAKYYAINHSQYHC